MDIKITQKPLAGGSVETEAASASQPAASSGIAEQGDTLDKASRPNFFSGRLLTAEDLQQEQQTVTGSVKRFWNSASMETKNFVLNEGAKLRTELPQMKEQAGNDANKLGSVISSQISESFRNYSMLGDISNADIASLVMLVMMEATKSAQEDLKHIMEQMQKQKIELQTSSLSFRDIASKVAIDFPDLSGDTGIQQENIRTKGALEYSHLLEQSRLEPSGRSQSDDDSDD